MVIINIYHEILKIVFLCEKLVAFIKKNERALQLMGVH
jgi:hypothetical protein